MRLRTPCSRANTTFIARLVNEAVMTEKATIAAT